MLSVVPKFSRKFIHNFVYIPADRQTDGQTHMKKQNLTSIRISRQ